MEARLVDGSDKKDKDQKSPDLQEEASAGPELLAEPTLEEKLSNELKDKTDRVILELALDCDIMHF